VGGGQGKNGEYCRSGRAWRECECGLARRLHVLGMRNFYG
jgi:hypothetical protein